MKSLSDSSRFIAKPLFALVFLCTAAFLVGRLWPDGATLLAFLPPPPSPTSSAVSISPNSGRFFPVATFSPPPPPPPQPPLIERLGVVDANGTMTDDFTVGEFSPEETEELRKTGDGAAEAGGEAEVGVRAKIGSFLTCPTGMMDHVPCWDGGAGLERRCPEKGKGLSCLVPAPKNYKRPLWPRCRDEVSFGNLRNTLVKDKSWQNELVKHNNMIRFSGGAKFPLGVDHYLNQLSKMVPDIQFGQRTRVALDVGSGVGSFGAFLLSRNVTTLSIATKANNDNGIQIALERGAAAMVASFTTNRLLYPSQAFDLIHCSDCQVNWVKDDGILLLEINRMLRAGGYFLWSAQSPSQQTWTEMEDLTRRICWELAKKEGSIAIWRKPLTNECYFNRLSGVQPPLCDMEDDPDHVWNVKMKLCISSLPENGLGANIPTGPARLYQPPQRLQVVKMDAYSSKPELLKAETKYWSEIVNTYVRAYRWNKLNLHNVMDMRAGFGGFAVALAARELNSWVMNVVPTYEPNTLPVIYDRGLIGVAHDWCKPFDSYPRTYDLLHAAFLFSREKKRCSIVDILLEMNRLLRPSGLAYIRDSTPIINEVKEITDAMGWKCNVQLTEEGLYSSRRFLRCDKP